jgi:hypothetical protein
MEKIPERQGGLNCSKVRITVREEEEHGGGSLFTAGWMIFLGNGEESAESNCQQE